MTRNSEWTVFRVVVYETRDESGPGVTVSRSERAEVVGKGIGDKETGGRGINVSTVKVGVEGRGPVQSLRGFLRTGHGRVY